MFQMSQKGAPDFEYFTIYDTKVGIYREPLLAINSHDILRQIQDTFRDPKHQNSQLFQNAEDFQLFKIGSFSKKTGEITGQKPEHIANLHEIRTAVLHNQQRTQDNFPREVSQSQLGSLPT